MVLNELQKEKIYLDYHKKVLGYIYNKVNNNDLAEDLTSDVFIKVYEKLDGFDASKSSMSTWIYTIARNTLIDYYRTRKVSEEIPETLVSDESVDGSLINKETLEELNKALQSLDERERMVVVMRYYGNKSLKEIAEHLGISYAYVKVIQNKALTQMKTLLKGL
ncbi:MAG: sigma-70 family RNA polymerase sigma factor [Clostridia bacterium]|nr:sigma-70 family RNA polymerase sigma factor [Clostridia bacterium]